MIHALVPAGDVVNALARQTPDTVFTQVLPVARDWFDQVVRVGSGLLTLSLLLLVLGLVPAFLQIRRTQQRIDHFLEHFTTALDPLIRDGAALTRDLREVTSVIRNDIHSVSDTVRTANARVRQAVDLTESRLNELSALLELIQNEGEDLVVSAASVVRGVRATASAFGMGGAGRSHPQATSDHQENGDGFRVAVDADDEDESPAPARARAPRIRPHRRASSDTDGVAGAASPIRATDASPSSGET